jgi:hypothetical protein
MPGIDEYNTAGSEYFKQSGFFINYEIQVLYNKSSKELSMAYQYSMMGHNFKTVQNKFEMLGLETFQTLLNLSIHLPTVANRYTAMIKEMTEREFKQNPESKVIMPQTVNDLRFGIATAYIKRLPIDVILKWWDTYVQVLVDVGLIKMYTMDDSPFSKFRK